MFPYLLLSLLDDNLYPTFLRFDLSNNDFLFIVILYFFKYSILILASALVVPVGCISELSFTNSFPSVIFKLNLPFSSASLNFILAFLDS